MPDAEKEDITRKQKLSKREVNVNLWNEVLKNAKGNSEEKIQSITAIFKHYYELPEKADELAARIILDGDTAVRMAVAKLMSEDHPVSLNLYCEIEGPLKQDHEAWNYVQSNCKLYIELKGLSESFRAIADALKPSQALIESLTSALKPVTLPRLGMPSIPEIPKLAFESPSTIAGRLALDKMADVQNLATTSSVRIARLTPGYFTESEVLDASIVEVTPEDPLIHRLKACPPGKDNWREYQVIVRDILCHIFSPPLQPPLEENEARDGHQRRDIIFILPFDPKGFWFWLKYEYHSQAIIVDAKNYSEELPANLMTIMSKYLGQKRLGTFGVVVTRYGLQDGAKDEQKRLWQDHETMIICLNDDDIIEMLALKNMNKKPEIVLHKKIIELRSMI